MKFILQSTHTSIHESIFYPQQYCGNSEYDIFINRKGMMFKEKSLTPILNLSEFLNQSEIILLFVGDEFNDIDKFEATVQRWFNVKQWL